VQSEREYWQKMFTTLAWQLPQVRTDDEDSVQPESKLKQMSYIAIEENNSVLFCLKEEKQNGEEEEYCELMALFSQAAGTISDMEA